MGSISISLVEVDVVMIVVVVVVVVAVVVVSSSSLLMLSSLSLSLLLLLEVPSSTIGGTGTTLKHWNPENMLEKMSTTVQFTSKALASLYLTHLTPAPTKTTSLKNQLRHRMIQQSQVLQLDFSRLK